MKTQTLNPLPLILMLVFSNALLLFIVRPINPFGILLMNVVAISVALGAIRYLRR